MRKIDIEEAKQIELNILDRFAQICKKNNLRYYLAYGTLIGAIRHSGFIPWDNDVDVVMPRPDYEKLLEIFEEECPVEYLELLDYRKHKTFPFAKIVDNRTVCKEHFLVTEGNMGLYIDIFPLDGMPDDENEQVALYKKEKILCQLYSLANYRFNTGSSFKMKLAKNLFYPISRLISSKAVCNKLNSLCKKYSYDTSEYVGDIVWGFDEREVTPRHLYESINWNFEGIEFSIPRGYDEILRKMYGDYMTLPPEEKRVTHEFDAYWK